MWKTMKRQYKDIITMLDDSSKISDNNYVYCVQFENLNVVGRIFAFVIYCNNNTYHVTGNSCKGIDYFINEVLKPFCLEHNLNPDYDFIKNNFNDDLQNSYTIYFTKSNSFNVNITHK